ncbi:MAG TPA: isoprenylcysteine carboxylmethyltransferase family protein [Pseudonocardia sp.]
MLVLSHRTAAVCSSLLSISLADGPWRPSSARPYDPSSMVGPVIDGDRAAALAVALCWSVLIVVWLVGAVHTARHARAVRERQRRGPAWLLGVAAYFGSSWAIPERAWDPLTVDSQWLVWTGVVLLAAATAFTLWARAALGTMWTSSAVVREGHELRTDGPYGITRHPIYTGFLGMLAGTALAAGLGRWILVAALALLLLWVKIRAEERLLESAFGARYRDYRGRVRALIPVPRRAAEP